MRKILEKLKKFDTPLCYGILCAVFGIAFIVLPYVSHLALDILLIVAGVFVIFVGILTVSLLDTTYRGIGYYISVGKTLLLIGCGIFLIVTRSWLAGVLCFGYGVYVLFRAVPTLIGCILLPKSATAIWWVKLILSIFEILLGLWLIIYPKWPSQYILAGAALLITAIDLFIKSGKKGDGTTPPRMMFGTVYDTEFEDKSDDYTSH